MCYHYKEPTKIQFKGKTQLLEARELNGFEHPQTVIFSNEKMDFEAAQWGLWPSWAKDVSFAHNTLNARVESLDEKASFKDVVEQRCLIFAAGFYEWQWLDAAGKLKKKFYITDASAAPLIFAGLYSDWRDPMSGDTLRTFTIVTTPADAFMATIHNTKQRMPIMLEPQAAEQWLMNKNFPSFAQLSLPLKAVDVDAAAAPELW